jgi:hypothetical protein
VNGETLDLAIIKEIAREWWKKGRGEKDVTKERIDG